MTQVNETRWAIRMKFRDGLPLLLLFLAFAVQAEEDEEEGPLSGMVKLGYLATTGNTETSSLNTGFDALYKFTRWEHAVAASALKSSENKVSTAEAYEAAWTSRWNMTERDFLYGRLSWRKDLFGAFRTQHSETLGYGRRILDTGVHTLNLEAGVGARQSEDQSGIEDDETILTGGLNYRWAFSETARFEQTLAVEAGDKNTFSESVTSVSSTLVGSLALTASYTIRNNSDVPIGTLKRDTRSAIALEYGF